MTPAAPPPSDAAPPPPPLFGGDADEVERLPDHVEADFAPPDPAPGGEPGASAAGGDGGRDRSLLDSERAQEAFDAAAAISESGDQERAVLEFLRASKLAERAREWYLAAIACRRVGDLFHAREVPHDLDRAFRMYRRAVSAFEQCGHFEDARQLSYRLMALKLRHAADLGLRWDVRVELFLYWLVAGFGYRPRRVLGSAVAVILGYALAYLVTDGVHGPDGEPVGPWQAIYFSGITFATIGYGDFVPAPHMRLIAFTEGATGALTMSFFVVVLASRLRH